MDILRAVTLHPVFVHVTLGSIPILLLAYGMAAAKKSDRWLFTGDVALFVMTGATLLTGTFGFISFFLIDWPGGNELWKWLHLGFGVATVTILLALATARLIARRKRRATPRYGALISAAVAVTLVAVFTGWVGGEVLVYRSGIAVTAAGNGALAPPVPKARRTPVDLMDAMGRIRGHFASALTNHVGMITHHPTAERFETIEQEARAMVSLGRDLATNAEEGHEHVDETSEHGQSEHEHDGFEEMARHLTEAASKLEQAAAGRDLTRVANALDGVEATCVRCHEAHRWKAEERGRPNREISMASKVDPRR